MLDLMRLLTISLGVLHASVTPIIKPELEALRKLAPALLSIIIAPRYRAAFEPSTRFNLPFIHLNHTDGCTKSTPVKPNRSYTFLSLLNSINSLAANWDSSESPIRRRPSQSNFSSQLYIAGGIGQQKGTQLKSVLSSIIFVFSGKSEVGQERFFRLAISRRTRKC